MKSRKPKSILIISERTNFRHRLESLLLLDAHTVLATKDPLDALDMARHRHLDVIATDIALPNMDGIELIANIRDLQEEVRIIAFSDGCTERERMALQKMDVYRCIEDPVSVEQAGEEIKDALSDREMARRNMRASL